VISVQRLSSPQVLQRKIFAEIFFSKKSRENFQYLGKIIITRYHGNVVGDVINAPNAVIYTPGEGQQTVEGANMTAADTIWLQPSNLDLSYNLSK
jgi:hypothetical protein